MTVLLIGAGRMGAALARGLSSSNATFFFDPHVPALEGAQRIGQLAPEAVGGAEPGTIVVAVKPQVLPSMIGDLRPFAAVGWLFVSIVAGTTLAAFGEALGPGARVVRAMPNTPAAIGRGITAAVPNGMTSADDRAAVEALLRSTGELIWLADEALLEAVTAVSGSGPAYFFRFAEAMARAGEALGLSPDVAMQLARATLAGAGALADHRAEPLAALRQEVTSPGGTTAAALAVFDADEALDTLIGRACVANAARARELGS